MLYLHGVLLVVLSAPLAGRLGLGISQAHAAVVGVNILNILERDGGNEARGLPCLADLAVELVNLLERQTLGLVDHGPGEEDTDEAASAPDEEDLSAEVGVAGSVVDHVGCSVTNGEVEKPVRSGCDGEGLSADLEREDLASNDPSDWAPRAGEEEDVNADECNKSLLGRLVVDAGNGTRDGDNELADSHTDGTEEQEVAATPLLDEVEAREGGSDVDSRCDHADSEGVAETGVLEERSSIVEDEVDTSQLLKRLEETTSKKTLAKAALEAIDVSSLAEREFVLMVGSDLSKLLDDSGVVDVKTPELGERLGSVFWAALLDEPTRSLGQEDAANEQDDGPCELHSDGNAVGSCVRAIFGGVVDDGGEQKTDGDSELVGTNNNTTNPFGRSLGLVERDGSTDHTDTVTSEEPTSDEERDRSCDSLQDDTDAEDDVASDETKTTTKDVGSGSSSQGTEESTGREDGDNQG